MQACGALPSEDTPNRVRSCKPRLPWLRSVTGCFFGRMVTFVDQHRALEDHHLLAMLIESLSFYSHNPLRRPGVGLSLGEHFRFGVESVPDKHRAGSFHIVPSQVSYNFGTDAVDTHTGQQGDGERAVHQTLFPFGLCSVCRVKVQLLRIHSK